MFHWTTVVWHTKHLVSTVAHCGSGVYGTKSVLQTLVHPLWQMQLAVRRLNRSSIVVCRARLGNLLHCRMAGVSFEQPPNRNGNGQIGKNTMRSYPGGPTFGCQLWTSGISGLPAVFSVRISLESSLSLTCVSLHCPTIIWKIKKSPATSAC